MKELQQPLEIASATLLESNNNTIKYIKPTDKNKKDCEYLALEFDCGGRRCLCKFDNLDRADDEDSIFLFFYFVQESEQKERRGVWCWLRLLKVGQDNPNGQIDRSSLCLFFSFFVLFTSPCP